MAMIRAGETVEDASGYDARADEMAARASYKAAQRAASGPAQEASASWQSREQLEEVSGVAPGTRRRGQEQGRAMLKDETCYPSIDRLLTDAPNGRLPLCLTSSFAASKRSALRPSRCASSACRRAPAWGCAWTARASTSAEAPRLGGSRLSEPDCLPGQSHFHDLRAGRQ